MIRFFILWVIFSFSFLIGYSSSDEVYENSNECNLFILALCFPAFLIVSIFLYVGEIIKNKNWRKE